MPLYEILVTHRAAILEHTVRRIAGNKREATDEELLESLPELFDDLVAKLRENAGLTRETATTLTAKSASIHGGQRLKLGFTITQLVHDYGAMCYAITDLYKRGQYDGITAEEFQTLNQVLDVAIADAVAEYSNLNALALERASEERANERLGFIAHELRNTIGAALLAFDAIRRGQVAIAGRTSNILEFNLLRLRALVDRSLTDVRLRSNTPIIYETVNFLDLVKQIEGAVTVELTEKRSRLSIQVDHELNGVVDHQLIISALSNLIQNAIKYSPMGATIVVRCSPENNGITFSVEDECGGIPENRLEELFSPFVRGASGGGGLGLGLSITRQAVESHGGWVSARTIFGKGCIFIMHIPTNHPSGGKHC